MITLLPPHGSKLLKGSTRLGCGGHSVVYASVDPFGGFHNVAVKIPRLGSEKSIKRELDALGHIGRHENIIKLFGTINTDDGATGIVLERYDSDLFMEVSTNGPFNNQRAALVMYQLVSAVAFVHAKWVVICDIKPENVLIRYTRGTEQVAICDFGLCHKVGAPIDQLVGTAALLPPEGLEKGVAGKPRDVWALGVLLFGVLSGLSAFDRRCWRETKKAIKYDPVPTESMPCDTSHDAKELILSLLEKNPATRPTTHELLEFDPFVILGAPRVPLLEIN